MLKKSREMEIKEMDLIFIIIYLLILLMQSPVDGKPMLLTPEESIQIQVTKIPFSMFFFKFYQGALFFNQISMLCLKCIGGNHGSLHNVILLLNKTFRCFKLVSSTVFTN